MSYSQILLNGKEITVYSEKEWFDLFTAYCEEIYHEKGESTGIYCCGYHWCCDECKCQLNHGCQDCVQTIIDIAESLDINIDRSDLNFQKFEEMVYKAYKKRQSKRGDLKLL